MVRRVLTHTYRGARKLVVALVGGTVLLLGAAMLVLPGPALLVIPIGLAILAIEFAWARRWLHRVKERSKSALTSLNNRTRAV